MMEKPKAYTGGQAYRNSKLANVMFTYDLARKLQEEGSNITVNCMCPGVVPDCIYRFRNITIMTVAVMIVIIIIISIIIDTNYLNVFLLRIHTGNKYIQRQQLVRALLGVHHKECGQDRHGQ